MVYASDDVTIRFNCADPGDYNAYVFIGDGRLPSAGDSEVRIENSWGFVIFAGLIMATKSAERLLVVRPALTKTTVSDAA